MKLFFKRRIPLFFSTSDLQTDFLWFSTKHKLTFNTGEQTILTIRKNELIEINVCFT